MNRFLPILLAAIILSLYGVSPGHAEDASEGPASDGAAIAFSPRTYSLGRFPLVTALADIDSDGDLDLIVTNPERHNISTLLNKGDGTFETGRVFPVEGYPTSLISVDIDGDADMDIVVIDSKGKVRTFFNSGDGEFSYGRGYPVEGYSFSISASDVDQDGDQDLVVLSAGTHTILLNDKDGGFDTSLAYPGGINSPTKMTADLNADERADMIIGDKEGVSVLLNNGDNTFAKGQEYATGRMPVAMAMGDMNSDDEDDLIVANNMGHTISILMSNGDGTFREAINYQSGKGPGSITLGDIDSDEDLDIIVANGLSGDVTVFINNTVRPLVIVTDSLPQGRRGDSYVSRLDARGGVPPYTWAVTSGSLPPSLYLNPSTGEMYSLSEHEGRTGDEAEVRGKNQGSRDRPSGLSKEVEEDEGHESHEDKGELLLSMDQPCVCLQAPRGLYRFTVQVADSASGTASADLYIEVLPKPGTLSGKISYSGEKKGNIRAGLWPLSRAYLMESFIGSLYSTTITTPGEYKIEKIYSAAYSIAAFMDVNGDGMRQRDEPYGKFVSKGPEGKSETVEVDDKGTEVTGIDIELMDSIEGSR